MTTVNVYDTKNLLFRPSSGMRMGEEGRKSSDNTSSRNIAPNEMKRLWGFSDSKSEKLVMLPLNGAVRFHLRRFSTTTMSQNIFT